MEPWSANAPGCGKRARLIGTRLNALGLYHKPASAFADTVEMVIGGILEDNDWQWPLWLHSEEWLKTGAWRSPK